MGKAAADTTISDAVAAIAQSDLPDAWSRYCELAPRLVRSDVAAADAPRELLRQRLRRISYPSRGGSDAEAHETIVLEDAFLDRLVTAAQGDRWHFSGIPPSGTKAVPIPKELITTEAIKRIRGDDRWELNGLWCGIRVVMEPPASPDQAAGAAAMGGMASVAFTAPKANKATLILDILREIDRSGGLASNLQPAEIEKKVLANVPSEWRRRLEKVGSDGKTRPLMSRTHITRAYEKYIKDRSSK
jgi:hypothetical protein